MSRFNQIVETLRKRPEPGWRKVKLPKIGDIVVNCMPREMAERTHANEVWVRLGTVENHRGEFRGSAEAVAKKLCALIKAPSRAVGEVADTLMTKPFNSLRPEEVAAMHNLDTDLTFCALALLEERCLVRKDASGSYYKV